LRHALGLRVDYEDLALLIALDRTHHEILNAIFESRVRVGEAESNRCARPLALVPDDFCRQLDLGLTIYVQRDGDFVSESAVRTSAEHAASNREILETIQTVDPFTMLKQNLPRDWDSKVFAPLPEHGTHDAPFLSLYSRLR
jgi:hypothetical protein